MATAERITELYPSFYVQSGSIASPVLREVVREEAPSSRARSTKGLLTKEAPTLAPSAPVKGVHHDYLVALFEYMIGMLESGVQLAKNQATVGSTETNAANASTKVSQALADKIAEEWKEYLAALEKAKHASFWTKIGMTLAGVLMVAIGAVIPQMALMGVMTIAMANGGSDAMEKALGLNKLPLGLKILAEVGIAVVLAAATCGASGVASALSVGTETAVTEATEAAVDAAAQAVEESAEASAEAGANVAANATNASGSVANQSRSFASKVFEEGFMAGRFRGANFAANASAMALFANPYTDLTVAVIRGLRAAGAHISDNAEAMASQIVGMIIGLVLAMGTGLCSSGGTQLGGTKLAQVIGEKAVSRMITTLKILTGLALTGSGVAGVFGGLATLGQADALDDLAGPKKDLSIYQGLIGILSQTISQTQTTSKIIADAYADINNRWGSFVSFYATAAEI